jgi:hypothetical protein
VVFEKWGQMNSILFLKPVTWPTRPMSIDLNKNRSIENSIDLNKNKSNKMYLNKKIKTKQ